LIIARQAEFEKQQPNIENFDGMAARLDALAVLTNKSQAMQWANLMIMLLFVAVETAPIFVKLISPKGPYDDLLDLAEKRTSVYAHEQTVKLIRASEKRLSELDPEFTLSQPGIS
jgi:hypothetical protein